MNVLVQALLFLCALPVNFLLPMLYGLEAYGAFIQANILVFLVQKLTDLVAEPLIGHVDTNSILALSMLLAALVWLLFVAVNAVTGIGSPALLAAMLLSSCAMLSMHALGLKKLLVIYLLLFLAILISMLVAKEQLQSAITIEGILFWTNLIPALGATAIIGCIGGRVPKTTEIRWAIASISTIVPTNLSMTLVFNLFTNVLPYVFSKALPLADLGLFRVATALIQSATTLFPVNTKAIFLELMAGSDSKTYFRTLLSWSMMYFATLGLAALGVASIDKRLLPFVALVASLPTLYWAAIAERYLQASHRRRQLLVANLVLGTLALAFAYLVQSIVSAVVYYSIGIALYAAWLIFLAGDVAPPIRLMTIVLLSPVAVLLQRDNCLWAIGYLAVSIAMSCHTFRPRLSELKRLGG